MSNEMANVTQLQTLLQRLGRYCDTGFALAIHIRYTRPSLLYRTYAPEWIEFYSEHGLMMADPVVHWGIANTGLVRWDDLTDHDPGGVIADAKRFGLHNGWTYSVGEPESRTISGFTKSGAAFTQAQLTDLVSIVDATHKLTAGLDQFPVKVQDALRALG